MAEEKIKAWSKELEPDIYQMWKDKKVYSFDAKSEKKSL